MKGITTLTVTSMLFATGSLFIPVRSIYSQNTPGGQEENISPVKSSWLKSKPLPESDTVVGGATRDRYALREARSGMFDSPFSQPLDKPVDPNAPQTGSGRFVLHRPIDRLPDGLSDAIMVGTVEEYQPYLSGDHGAIYTELTFNPMEVLKSKSGLAQVGNAVAILQHGGSIELNDGRTIGTPPSSGESTLEVKKQYLVFLSYHSSTESFSVIKSWELPEGKAPVELDTSGRPISVRGSSGFTDKAALLNELRRSVSAHEAGLNR